MEAKRRILSFGLVAVLLVAAAPGRAAPNVRKAVAVQVLPVSETDVEVAVQVRKIAVDTLENYRNLLTRRYLTDKDEKLQEELGQLVDEANRKVSTGMRSRVFDEGVEGLNRAYLKSKGALGEMEPKLVARLYLGLSMSKAVMKDMALARDYMTLYANVMPGKGRQSVGYNKLFLGVWDEARKVIDETNKYRVVITAEPVGALVGVDGRIWGKAPLEVELSAGSHLVQVEAEGYHRAGWLKDPRLDGARWRVELKPLVTRTRFLETNEKLRGYFSPAPPPEPVNKGRRGRRGKGTPAPPAPALSQAEAEGLLASLQKLLNADYLLFVTVRSEGANIVLTGAFHSRFGVYPIAATVARDATTIDSVRKIVLAASDMEQQKEALAKQGAARQQERLTTWADDLLGEMDGGLRGLEQNGRQWELLGQAKKAELFVATAGEVAALVHRARAARGRVHAEPEAARKELDEVAGAWKTLGEKVSSLLAWDLERALQARRVKDVRALAAEAKESHRRVAGMLNKRKEALGDKAWRIFDKQLAAMAKSRRRAEERMAREPLDKEARVLLFQVLIEQAELARKLTLLHPE